MTQLTRLQTIAELLRTRQEVLEWEQEETAGRSRDSRSLQLPHDNKCDWPRFGKPCTCPIGSYLALELNMRLLRRAEPTLWWHVHERYERCWRRTVKVRVKVKRVHGRNRYEMLGLSSSQEALRYAGQTGTEDVTNGDGPAYRVVIDEWHPQVKREHVTAGIQWLSNHWQGRSPQLPHQILKQIAA